jgi:hypothetical protein
MYGSLAGLPHFWPEEAPCQKIQQHNAESEQQSAIHEIHETSMPLKPGTRNNLMAAHSTPRPDRQLGFVAWRDQKTCETDV